MILVLALLLLPAVVAVLQIVRQEMAETAVLAVALYQQVYLLDRATRRVLLPHKGTTADSVLLRVTLVLVAVAAQLQLAQLEQRQ